MARPIRVEYADAVYHVTARGNERKAIYRDDADRRRFLETVEEAVERFGLVIHAFCLMPNHYHLLLQTPRANLSAAVGWMQTTYSIRFNRRHHRSGHLFQGRYKAHVVDKDTYARELITYIHLNPVRPRNKRKPIPAGQKKQLARYRWSSHRAYAGIGGEDPPSWLCLDWLSYFGRTRRVAQEKYRQKIDQVFGRNVCSPWEDLRKGLVLGGETFWNKVRKLVAQSDGDEEIRFRQRADAEDVVQAVKLLVDQESNLRVAMWLRVRVGGERMTKVAAEYGYRDGSGVYRVIERLEEKAKSNPSLSRRLKALAAKVSSVKS